MWHDWQLVRSGSPWRDVNYFLVTALTIEERRSADRDLVEHYRLRLIATGTHGVPGRDEAWQQFMRWPAYGTQAWLGNINVWGQSDGAEMVARFFAASDDYDTINVLTAGKPPRREFIPGQGAYRLPRAPSLDLNQSPFGDPGELVLVSGNCALCKFRCPNTGPKLSKCCRRLGQQSGEAEGGEGLGEVGSAEGVDVVVGIVAVGDFYDHDDEEVEVVQKAAALFGRRVEHGPAVGGGEVAVFTMKEELGFHEGVGPQGPLEIDDADDVEAVGVSEDVEIPHIPMHEAGNRHLVQRVAALNQPSSHSVWSTSDKPSPNASRTINSAVARSTGVFEILVTTAHDRTLTPVFGALKDRDFRLWFGTQTFSASGTVTQSVAAAWIVLQLTGRSTDLAILTAVTLLPLLVLGSWAGSLSDRHDRRRLLLATQIAFVAMGAVMTVLAARNAGPTLNRILIVAGVTGVVNAIDSPARKVYVLDLVGEERWRAR